MTNYKFRLETLLRLRIAERDQRRADLAKALRAEEMLRAEDQAVERQQAAAAEESRRLKSPGSADVDALLQTHRFELALTTQRRTLASQIAQVQAEAERRRLALVEADRQVRVLEKLRARQAAAHRRESERLDVKQFDELAAQAFVRRQEAPA
jgi:flagellar FliJ protein